jgi:hypothetical protein
MVRRRFQRLAVNRQQDDDGVGVLDGGDHSVTVSFACGFIIRQNLIPISEIDVEDVAANLKIESRYSRLL